MSSSDSRRRSSKSKKKVKAPGRKKKEAKPKVTKTKKAAKGGKVVETKKKAEAEKKPQKEKVEKKPKKSVEKKLKAEKTPGEPRAKAEPLTLGPSPSPTVMSRHVDSMHHRAARGFSFGELESAAVPLYVAKREGLQLDLRRRSVLDGNVELLKGWFKSPQGSKSTAAS
jgi:ribosomal protein L13E